MKYLADAFLLLALAVYACGAIYFWPNVTSLANDEGGVLE